jgi:hypothetical protein
MKIAKKLQNEKNKTYYPLNCMDVVHRFDQSDQRHLHTTPLKKTAEGYLVGRAVVTNVGVFRYRRADGSTIHELRLPEEVFAQESLDSLKLKPVTLSHPTERLDPANVATYQIGSLGDNPSNNTDGDGFHVAVDMTITRQDGIEAVNDGIRSLSMGYTCELEQAAPGACWCGMPYDYIQRKIRYDHCAVVPKGRAGDAAQLRIDEAFQVIEEYDSKTIADKGETMKKIHIDSVEYEGDEGLIRAYSEERKRADSLTTSFEKLKAEYAEKVGAIQAAGDAHKARADKAEADLKDALNPKHIDEIVATRLFIVDTATKAGIDITKDMSEETVKETVIGKVFPDIKLDGKESAYKNALFDIAAEELNKQTQRVPPTSLHRDEKTPNAEHARLSMIQKMRNAHQEKE